MLCPASPVGLVVSGSCPHRQSPQAILRRLSQIYPTGGCGDRDGWGHPGPQAPAWGVGAGLMGSHPPGHVSSEMRSMTVGCCEACPAASGVPGSASSLGGFGEGGKWQCSLAHPCPAGPSCVPITALGPGSSIVSPGVCDWPAVAVALPLGTSSHWSSTGPWPADSRLTCHWTCTC